MIFYIFATLLLFSAAMAIVSSHTVKSVLFLVLAFIASAVLWVLLEAEFLGLILIVVYVGAVMTLFLFVVMMLSTDKPVVKKKRMNYFFTLAAIILLSLLFIVSAEHLGLALPLHTQQQGSNITQIGLLLFHEYWLPFELSACLLFVAIITAIYLTHRGPQNAKKQSIAAQIAVKRQDRIRLIKGDDL